MLRIVRLFAKPLQIIHFSSPNVPVDPPKLPSSPESFFADKPFTLKNALILLQQFALKGRLKDAQELQRKMKEKGFSGQRVGLLMIKCASRARQIKTAQKYFKEESESSGHSIQLFTNLMEAYSRKGHVNRINQIQNEVSSLGLEPNMQFYEVALQGYSNGKKIQRCWQIYNQVKKKGLQRTALFYQQLLKACIVRNQAQRAIYLIRQMHSQQIQSTQRVKDLYLHALANRTDYAEKAIQYFYQLLATNKVSALTFAYALAACSTLGDVTNAFSILSAMKKFQFSPTQYTLNQVLKVYAKACTKANLQNIELYVTDAWKVFQQLQNWGKVSSFSVNNLLELYSNIGQMENLQGLVLPLYQRYGLQKNQRFYELMLRTYKNNGDLGLVLDLWQMARKDQVPLTFGQVDVYLESSVKLSDIKRTVQALRLFKQIKRQPRVKMLRQILLIQNLPEQIYAQLMDFTGSLGIMAQKDSIKRLTKSTKSKIQTALTRQHYSL